MTPAAVPPPDVTRGQTPPKSVAMSRRMRLNLSTGVRSHAGAQPFGRVSDVKGSDPDGGP